MGDRDKPVVGLCCGPPTTEVHVGPCSLKGNDDRRTESGGATAGVQFWSAVYALTDGASSVSASGLTSLFFVDITDLFSLRVDLPVKSTLVFGAGWS